MKTRLTTWIFVLLVLHLCPGVVRAQTVVINEFMADNDHVLADEDGEYRDWIELHNAGTTTVELAGWHLTDAPGTPGKWAMPSRTLAPNAYLVIFASGKDRRPEDGELHTSFSLNAGGEFLGLVGTNGYTVVHAYAPYFPEQLTDVSYGISTNPAHGLRYFATPTPGGPNGGDYLGLVADTKFSADRGFYTNAVQVAITTGTGGAEIRYSLDGSTPSPTHGEVYAAPVAVSNTAPLRAIAWKPGWRTTDVDTHTYLFLDQVIAAGVMGSNITQHPIYGPQMTDALRALPALSLVTTTTNINWDPELPVSVEFLWPDGRPGIQVDAGISRYGGFFAPIQYEKRMFRLYFRSQYGSSKLDYPLFEGFEHGVRAVRRFDQLDLRSGSHDMRLRGFYMSNRWFDDTMLELGHVNPHGRFVHLYLNGIYWGQYHLRERWKADTMAEYFGGTESDYEAVVRDNAEPIKVVDGDGQAWQRVIALSTNYHAVKAYLDVPQLLDWHFLWMFGQSEDEYRAAGPIEAGIGYKMQLQDADGFLRYGFKAATDPGPENLVGRLSAEADPDFEVLRRDRIFRAFFNDGALTPERNTARLLERCQEIETAFIAESARWYHMNASHYRLPDEWALERDNTLAGFNTRTDAFLDRIRAAGMYPVEAPLYSQRGGVFTNQTTVSLTHTHAIYYTLDGTDPRESGTGVATGTFYNGPILLTQTTLVKARALEGTQWSALNEAVFILDPPPELTVTEVMYNPREADAFEFIELRNDGAAAIGLAGLRFTEGIAFDFNTGEVLFLEPGEHVLVISDRETFATRYDTGQMQIAGEYSANLDNGGERVTLIDGRGSNVLSFAYGDGRDWPLAADGAGHSLVPLVFNDQTNRLDYGGNWRASAFIDGSPGQADPTPIRDVLLNEIVAHTDYSNAVLPQYDSDDWIELYNTSASDTGLNDWYLSDDADALKKWAIPPSTVITGRSWLTFTEVEDFHNPITNGFGLNKAGEQVFLSYLPDTDADRVADCVRFKGQENGLSLGRYEDGEDNWFALTPTTNAANARPAERIIISELMFHPAPTVQNPEDNTNDEYIEIYNPAKQPVALETEAGPWRLDGGVSYTFPPGTSVAGGSTLLLVSFDPLNNAVATSNFLAAYAFEFAPRLLGPYTGKLSNNGERIALEKPQAADPPSTLASWIIVDEVIYSAYAPWPQGANGTGKSLVRLAGVLSGNDPLLWRDNLPLSPGIGPTKLALTAPEQGKEYLVPFTLTVNAEVDPYQTSGTVQRVTFFHGAEQIAIDTNGAPYQCTFSSSSNEGSYAFSAQLTDAAGVFTSGVSVIRAVGPLLVTNTGASNITDIAADVYGRIEGEGIDYAAMTLFWGPVDGGSNKSNWAHSKYVGNVNTNNARPHAWINGLTPATTYVYRWYATRAQGEKWADTPGTFKTQDYADWSHRMNITFDGYAGTDTLTNFPVLVKLHAGISGFAYSQFASASGYDLRFDDPDRIEALSYDVESWNTGGTSYVWVRVPELSTDTVIRAHWGFAQVAQEPLAYAVDGSTWSEGYAAVWHLDDTLKDATLQNADALNDGSADATGAIAGGQVFDGLDDVLAHAPPLDWYHQNHTHLTVTFWARPTDYGNAVFGSDANTNTMGRALNFYMSSNPRVVHWYLVADDSITRFAPYELGQWQLLTLVMDDSTILAAKNDEGLVLAHTNTAFSIAYAPTSGNKNGGSYFFEGGIDEIRMSSVARSADWIAAEYATVAEHESFTAYAEVVAQGPEVDADHNGLPDAWELHFFQTTGIETGAHGDSDLMDNYSEYLAGTDPTNSDDYFSISIDTTSGAPFVWFQMRPATNPFYTDLSRNYALETARALTNGAWYRLPDASNLPAMDGIFTYTNVHPLTDGGRFYRGRVWLHPDE